MNVLQYFIYFCVPIIIGIGCITFSFMASTANPKYIAFVIIFPLLVIFHNTFFETSSINLGIPLLFTKGNPFKYYLSAYLAWVQAKYEYLLEILLFYPVSRPIIRGYISFLFFFRVSCNEVSKIPYFNSMVMFIAILCSRLHLAGYMIILCLIIIRLDQSFNRIAIYYRKNPNKLVLDFPYIIGNRYMWSRAGKVVLEAAENPMVQATAVAVTGALAWKALDVIDKGRQLETTQAEIAAEAIQRDEDRKTEAKERQLDREADAQQQALNREADAKQQALNREAENQRHRESLAAENKSNSPFESIDGYQPLPDDISSSFWSMFISINHIIANTIIISTFVFLLYLAYLFCVIHNKKSR